MFARFARSDSTPPIQETKEETPKIIHDDWTVVEGEPEGERDDWTVVEGEPEGERDDWTVVEGEPDDEDDYEYLP